MKPRNVGSTLDSFFAATGELDEVRKLTETKVRAYDRRTTMPSDTPNIEKLYDLAIRLRDLLADPHPGYVSWRACVYQTAEGIGAFVGMVKPAAFPSAPLEPAKP